MMEIVVARKAGFCFGVRRAIRMVEKALAGTSTVYSLGPVIHNPQVIKNLKGMGLKVVERLEDIDGGVVIIRSHGAPPHTYPALTVYNLKPFF